MILGMAQLMNLNPVEVSKLPSTTFGKLLAKLKSCEKHLKSRRDSGTCHCLLLPVEVLLSYHWPSKRCFSLQRGNICFSCKLILKLRTNSRNICQKQVRSKEWKDGFMHPWWKQDDTFKSCRWMLILGWKILYKKHGIICVFVGICVYVIGNCF